jgi:predicted GNAT family N-acyltransferase
LGSIVAIACVGIDVRLCRIACLAAARRLSAKPSIPSEAAPQSSLVGCTLIGRLAIAKDQRGQRRGFILLADAPQRAFDSVSTVGSSMVIVDASGEAAAGFHAAHGFVRLPNSLRLALPMRQAAATTE